MRRIFGALALLSVLASPTVARTRFFCRFTGAEITDCEERRAPEQTVIEKEGCCERRAVHALEKARTASGDPLVDAPAAPVLAQLPFPPARRGPSLREPCRSADAGPPLFLVQRALLI